MNKASPVINPEVLRICRSSPVNARYTSINFIERFILTEQMDRLRVLDGVVYTWCRVPWVMQDTSDAIDLAMNDGTLWLLDLIYEPGVSAMQACRRTAADMVQSGFGEPGELVRFKRDFRGRYGTTILPGHDRSR